MDAVDYLEELIRFDSVSAKSNVDVTDWVDAQLAELGFATEQVRFTDPDGVPKSNVIGKMGPGKGGMAYFGHTDVVPADEWFTDEHGPFEPTIKGEKLYGRGSCDMKGSVACMLAAAARVEESELTRPVYITCTADEEVGYRGASQVAADSEMYREMVAGQSNAIIGEPTLLEVVYAHKGTVQFIATSHGQAAHSSTTEGLNANLAMIPFLVEMKRIHDETESDPAWQNDEFDPPTVSWNIGINDHTHAVNIKPPQSVCTVYFRPMPEQDPESLLSRVHAAAEANGIELSVRKQAPPLYVDPDSAFVHEVLELAGRSAPRTVAYGTDGAVFTALEKRVVYGPGSIAQAHTHDEFIELSQLDAGTRAYETLIRRWCC